MAVSKVVYKSSANATPVVWMDATPATAAAADIISPKTAMLANGVVTTGTGSGGGASNIVTGTFTAGTAGAAQSVTISYTGSGYPIACYIYPSAGSYNSSTGIYSSTQYKAILQLAMSKANISTTPDYSTSNVEKNWAGIFVMYKNSSSDSTNYAATTNKSGIAYTSYSPNGSAAPNSARFSGATTLKVYIAGSSEYGFLSGTEYTYLIMYSS